MQFYIDIPRLGDTNVMFPERSRWQKHFDTYRNIKAITKTIFKTILTPSALKMSKDAPEDRTVYLVQLA